MKLSLFAIFLLLITSTTVSEAQTRKAVAPKPKTSAPRSAEIGQTAVIEDETLSVLRKEPSLFSESIQRMRRGRKVQVLGVTEADGIKFYKVAAPPASFGWVQADAVFGKFRESDEERLARLVQAIGGFDQIEIAGEFFGLYPNSKFRPPILLLYGDLLEEASTKLTKDANSRLTRKEMAASGAPMHSYFLNFVSLDRYRKLGIIFLFNSTTRQFHYDGASWKEIIAKFPNSPEALEAKKRLDALTTKMTAASAK